MEESNKKCDCKECIIRNLIFSHLKSNEFENICNYKVQKNFKKGEIIIEIGQKLDYLIYLKSGLVKYYVTLNDGRSHIISISVPFDGFSLLTIFHKDNLAQYYMSALEDSTLCYIPINLIKELILKNGDFSLNFITKLNHSSNKIIIDFVKLYSKNLRGRVAFFLLQLSERVYNGNCLFELPLSRKEIAELIGMTTENVIRTLSEFRKEKIIKINGKEIEITEKERLFKISLYG
jgi:CRP/FNR family transcriptional regulator